MPSVAYQRRVLLRSQWDHREPAFANQRGAGEDFVGFDLGECGLPRERFSGADFHFRHFGVGGVHGDGAGSADRGPQIPGFVDDQFRAGLHFAQVFDSCGAGDAVPQCGFIVQKIGEGVLARFCLQKIVVSHGGNIRPCEAKGKPDGEE
jgi:hypothetical protein